MEYPIYPDDIMINIINNLYLFDLINFGEWAILPRGYASIFQNAKKQIFSTFKINSGNQHYFTYQMMVKSHYQSIAKRIKYHDTIRGEIGNHLSTFWPYSYEFYNQVVWDRILSWEEYNQQVLKNFKLKINDTYHAQNNAFWENFGKI